MTIKLTSITLSERNRRRQQMQTKRGKLYRYSSPEPDAHSGEPVFLEPYKAQKAFTTPQDWDRQHSTVGILAHNDIFVILHSSPTGETDEYKVLLPSGVVGYCLILPDYALAEEDIP